MKMKKIILIREHQKEKLMKDNHQLEHHLVRFAKTMWYVVHQFLPGYDRFKERYHQEVQVFRRYLGLLGQ